MILPLPRTGPSSRCRLQLTTKMRLSSCSRAARLERGLRLGLVHLAVADEAPHRGCRRVDDVLVLEVAVEARLVDRVQRAEAHRHGGELPEVRHAARVGVARQAFARSLAAEVVELLLGEPAFQECARVHAWRGVTLHVEQVAGIAVSLAVEEVVEAHLVERRRACVRGEVPAETVEPVVGPVDHRHRVPAHERTDAALEILVAGEPRFLRRRDRVHVVGLHERRHRDALVARPLQQAGEEIVRRAPGP